jgi:uncharacterized protein YjgD (DUF1641 family)
MAQQIRLTLPPRDPRAVLQSRLQHAPAEHAEALLSAYEVLQGLHNNGILELLRGLLGSSDDVLEIAVETAKSPQSLRSIRNLILVVNMLGEIDPDQLKTLTTTAADAVKSVADQPESPGLWKLMMQFLWNKDAKRGLSALNRMLAIFGKNLGQQTTT